MFCLEISAGAFVPGKMKSSPAGMLDHAERGSWKFLESTSNCRAVSRCHLSRFSTTYRIMSKDFRREERVVL